jgi:hypothetical protein
MLAALFACYRFDSLTLSAAEPIEGNEGQKSCSITCKTAPLPFPAFEIDICWFESSMPSELYAEVGDGMKG